MFFPLLLSFLLPGCYIQQIIEKWEKYFLIFVVSNSVFSIITVNNGKKDHFIKSGIEVVSSDIWTLYKTDRRKNIIFRINTVLKIVWQRQHHDEDDFISGKCKIRMWLYKNAAHLVIDFCKLLLVWSQKEEEILWYCRVYE